MARQAWYAKSAAQVCRELGGNPTRGLSEVEAGRRLLQDGPNRLPEPHRPGVPTIVARQFASPLVLLLIAAAAAAGAIGEPADTVAIVTIVLLNAALGFVQEWKAERELQALREILVPRCTVWRDGESRRVPSLTVVRGDVLVLHAGDRVAADARLIESRDLAVDEAVLTGESLPVSKSTAEVDAATPLQLQTSMVWTGTSLTTGSGRAVVVATGADTEFGRIAEMAGQLQETPSPLQRRLATLARSLGVVAVAVAAGLVALGVAGGRPLGQMLMTGVSLAVAIVPEGLPAVVTLTLALGIRRLVRARVLLRRLSAAEAIGAATFVCADKTGTLTAGEMTVRRVWMPHASVEITGSGYTPEGGFRRGRMPVQAADVAGLGDLLDSAHRAGDGDIVATDGAWQPRGDPMEAALAVAARKAGRGERGERVGEVPFTEKRKCLIVLEADGDGVVVHAKGALQALMARATSAPGAEGGSVSLDEAGRRAFEHAEEQLASEGLRVLAVARHRFAETPTDDAAGERDLCLLGLVGLADPPRPEVAGAIATATAAGVEVAMVTGDGPGTARAVAREIGLPVHDTLTGDELASLDDEELQARFRRGGLVLARTLPEHKLRIVQVLQALGHVVGMTGDGVNDAPALKAADIGIAMGVRGTDVARGASDLVLTDDNFDSIVNAIREGRRQYDNIRRFVGYLLSSNAGEFVAITFNLVTGAPLILLPVQLLWINLLTDGPQALALGLEPEEANLMSRPPRSPSRPLLDADLARRVLLAGSLIGAMVVAAFYWSGEAAWDSGRAGTLAFTVIILAETLNVLNFRAGVGGRGVLRWRSNPALLAAIAVTLALHVAAIYAPPLQRLLRTVPLEPHDWGVAVLAAVPVLVLARLPLWRERPAAAFRPAGGR